MRFNIPLEDVLSSRAKLKIIKHLFGQEAPMSESELASVIGVSHMTANRLLKELSAFNLVSVRRVANANVWTVNKESFAYQTLAKIITDVVRIPQPLDDLKKRIIKHLPAELVEMAVVFGSIARGEEEETSDIDLFVLVPSDKARMKIEESVNQLTGECLTLYGNRLAPYILTKSEWQAKKDLPLFEEIEKGIKIKPKS